MIRAASGRARRPATAAAAGVGVRRVAAVAGAAFLAGIGFHAIAATDRPLPATRTAAAAVDAPLPNRTAVGPTRLVEGVPAGFANTEAGAVAAAASFVATGQALIDMDPLATEDAVRQMATGATADRQVTRTLAALSQLRQVLRAGTGPVTVHQAAMATRLERFGAGRARVAVWNVTVLARDGIAPPQAGWKVSTYELVWERDDWRIDAETVTPGPAPVLDDSTPPATSAQLDSALDGFSPFTGTVTEGARR